MNRPRGARGLADAVDLLHEGHAQALWVEDISRLARELLVQETILRDVWAADARVYIDGAGQELPKDDADDPSRRLIRQVLGAVAEYERISPPPFAPTSDRGPLRAQRRVIAVAGVDPRVVGQHPEHLLLEPVHQ